MKHYIKTSTEVFPDVQSGVKLFEYRLNDRNYHAGDTLILQEWDNRTQAYTGRQAERYVPYILYGGVFEIPKDMCIMSIIPPMKGSQ